jgi:hypothetical protein
MEPGSKSISSKRLKKYLRKPIRLYKKAGPMALLFSYWFLVIG